MNRRLKISDASAWGWIIILWTTALALLIIQHTAPDVINYIQFDGGNPQPVTPNTTPPLEA